MGYVETETSLAIHVQEKSTDRRTGVLGGQPGWQWDRRQVEQLDDPSSYYDDSIVLSGPIEGFLKSEYRDGMVHGLAYKDIALLPQGFKFNWVPRVEAGWYTAGASRLPMLSDHSAVKRFDADDVVSGLNTVQLGTAVSDPVFVAVYRRDKDLKATPWMVWNILDINTPFTGYLNEGTGVRANAEPGGVPTANLMDQNKREAKLNRVTGALQLNGTGVFQIGNNSTDQSSLENIWESAGISAPGRIIYTEFFPIVGDVSVVAWWNGTAQTYTEVSDWTTTSPSDFHFIVDRDLGIIYLSGYQPEPAYLGDSGLSDTAKVVQLVPVGAAREHLPTSGKVTIDTETFTYTIADAGTLLGLTRASGANHAGGAKVTWTQQGTWAGNDNNEAQLYIAYQYGPRVDYEVSTHTVRSANYSSWLDLHPLRRVSSQGVLQVSTTALNVDRLSLELDAPAYYGSAFYGPLYFGTSFTQATVTAYDLAGNRVSDIEITIDILDDGTLPGVGRFGNGQKTYSGFSNLQGEVFASYNAPLLTGETEIVLDAGDFTISGGNTEITFPINLEFSDKSKIFLFQVLKNDPFFGALGYQVSTYTTGSDAFGNYLVIDEQVDADLYEGGRVIGKDLDAPGEQVVNIVRVVNSKFVDGTFTTKVYIDTALDGAYTDDPIWLLQATSVRWNASILNGSRVLTYIKDSDRFYPLIANSWNTDQTGIVYEGIELPLPDPDDDSNPVGAYIAVAPRQVTLQAHCYDPASGRRIESNVAVALVQLSPTFIGEWKEGIESHYGFRPGYPYEAATGLGGANYYTINPISRNINRLSLTSLIAP